MGLECLGGGRIGATTPMAVVVRDVSVHVHANTFPPTKDLYENDNATSVSCLSKAAEGYRQRKRPRLTVTANRGRSAVDA